MCLLFIRSKIYIYFLLFIFSFLSANASLCANVNGSSSIQITDGLIAFELQPLHFGLIFPDPTGDIITQRPNGNRRALNGSSFGQAGSFGLFRIQGNPRTLVTISFTDGVLSGPGQDMAIQNFQINRTTPIFLNGRGFRQFRVGADLIVSADQASGVYNGTYTITVEYQ